MVIGNVRIRTEGLKWLESAANDRFPHLPGLGLFTANGDHEISELIRERPERARDADIH